MIYSLIPIGVATLAFYFNHRPSIVLKNKCLGIVDSIIFAIGGVAGILVYFHLGLAIALFCISLFCINELLRTKEKRLEIAVVRSFTTAGLVSPIYWVAQWLL